ncbi:MAG: hypothetical protein HY293_14995 [Planctomycetes bacterium]|nr:hypothetical protein [Planctomycetota bacterium]
MSGSSRVEQTSVYFHLSSETPCLNFATNPDDPGHEQRFHREWTEKATEWLVRARLLLDQRFSLLAAAPDPEWPIVAYEERYPLWRSYRPPETPPPWRLNFLGMNGPGLTQVTIAFSRLPSEEAKERLKQELVKVLGE